VVFLGIDLNKPYIHWYYYVILIGSGAIVNNNKKLSPYIKKMFSP
jgi:hypothetical protein